jgi:hypothetical protein
LDTLIWKRRYYATSDARLFVYLFFIYLLLLSSRNVFTPPSDGQHSQISPDLIAIDPMWGIIGGIAHRPPEEVLNIAPKIFLGKFYVVSKFTGFAVGWGTCVPAVTNGQAGSGLKAEVPSRVAKEPPRFTLNYIGTVGG